MNGKLFNATTAACKFIYYKLAIKNDSYLAIIII